MLELRPNCECCDIDLVPDQPGAMICSFECTFCEDCAIDRLRGECPNCGGELLPPSNPDLSEIANRSRIPCPHCSRNPVPRIERHLTAHLVKLKLCC